MEWNTCVKFLYGRINCFRMHTNLLLRHRVLFYKNKFKNKVTDDTAQKYFNTK